MNWGFPVVDRESDCKERLNELWLLSSRMMKKGLKIGWVEGAKRGMGKKGGVDEPVDIYHARVLKKSNQ